MCRQEKWRKKMKKKPLLIGLLGLLALVILVAVGYGSTYFSTPAHIRNPSFQHYHFRTQILVDGKAVDFSKDEFQTETANSGTCSAAVGSAPIDFHDKTDQLTHVHWNGMTGGEFLKFYGWNYIGGNDEVIGHRYDDGLNPSPVNVHGNLLPAVPDNGNFYVYIGDKENYQQKSWDDFLSQDLESFFGKNSNIGHNDEISFSVSDWLFPTAYAHGEVMDEHASNKSEEELTRINNLVGNVVIFAQEEEPAKEQIQERFDNLVPLHESRCGD